MTDKTALIDFIRVSIPNIIVAQNALERIAEDFEELNLEKNEFLLKVGRVSGYYYLAEGYLRAFTLDTEGKEITTNFYGRERVIFEPSTFFHSLPSSENIQALAPCRGFVTSFDKLNKLFHSFSEFREFGRAMLVKEFVLYKRQTLAMINKSAEQRYADLISSNAEIFQYAQLRHIASFLGITDSSLSRIRREFSRP